MCRAAQRAAIVRARCRLCLTHARPPVHTRYTSRSVQFSSAQIHQPLTSSLCHLTSLCPRISECPAPNRVRQVTSALGNAGQASYAAANAHLDGLAQCRRAHAQGCRSTQLPLVATAGMGAATVVHAAWAETSSSTLALEEYAGFLGATFTSHACALVDAARLPYFRSKLIVSAPWALQSLRADPAACVAVSPARATDERVPSTCGSMSAQGQRLDSPRLNVAAAQRRAHTIQLVQRVVVDLGGTIAGVDSPLMEAGLDSLAATELPSRLTALTGATLASTLAFDQPTPRALAGHVLEQVDAIQPRTRPSSAAPAPMLQSPSCVATGGLHGAPVVGVGGECHCQAACLAAASTSTFSTITLSGVTKPLRRFPRDWRSIGRHAHHTRTRDAPSSHVRRCGSHAPGRRSDIALLACSPQCGRRCDPPRADDALGAAVGRWAGEQ